MPLCVCGCVCFCLPSVVIYICLMCDKEEEEVLVHSTNTAQQETSGFRFSLPPPLLNPKRLSRCSIYTMCGFLLRAFYFLKSLNLKSISIYPTTATITTKKPSFCPLPLLSFHFEEPDIVLYEARALFHLEPTNQTVFASMPAVCRSNHDNYSW